MPGRGRFGGALPSRAVHRRLLSSFLCLTLLLSPVVGRAQTVEAPLAPPVPVDNLGRPFPDPFLVRRANGWLGGGATMAGVGAALLVSGLFVGSAMVRGELESPTEGRVGAVAMLAGGAVLGFSGLPLISAGRHTRGQLLRTIRGVEKVPRTVANERRYWDSYLAHEQAQAVALGGGGMLMLGVVNVVAVAALVGTELYDARYWLSAVGTLSAGGVTFALGMWQGDKTKAQMKAIRDEVDPPRTPTAFVLPSPPLPTFSFQRDRAGRTVATFGLAWATTF